MPSRVARLRLAQAVESQFDTSAVAAFEALLAGALEEYRTAKRADFEPNYSEDEVELAEGSSAESEPGLDARRERGLTPPIPRRVHRQGGPRSDSDLVEHVVNMNLDRCFTDEEFAGDLRFESPTQTSS